MDEYARNLFVSFRARIRAHHSPVWAFDTMKPSAKVKSAPPICGVGGGAYSREISSHAYAPVIIRKNRVKRDVASQFILCTTCADEVRPNDFQSARQDYVGKNGEVPCAAGRPRAKTVSHQVKWNNYVHSSIADGRATLTSVVAEKALAKIEEHDR